jgi:hypothetical protein
MVTVTAKSLERATSPAADAHGVRGGRVDDVDVGGAHGMNTPSRGRAEPSRCPASSSSGLRWARTGSRTVLIALAALAGCGGSPAAPDTPHEQATERAARSATARRGTALAALERLPVKGRAPKTGYDREQFGTDWASVDGCDMRERILERDLRRIVREPGEDCEVQTGVLTDPYTATAIRFVRGGASEVDIDHVVALGDAWQTGAQQWTFEQRVAFANDPLNLLAVDAAANRQKADSDAASWLPSNKAFRCAYVARQIAVKRRYRGWVTAAEHDAMKRVLAPCPRMRLPRPSPRG